MIRLLPVIIFIFMRISHFPGHSRLLLCVLTALALSQPSWAASSKDKNKRAPSADISAGVPSFSMPNLSRGQSDDEAYDFAVDPSTYVLGPGDRIGIDVIGETYLGFECDVNPQNGIVVPEIGFIPAGNRTIDEFKTLLFPKLRKSLRFDSIAVYLIEAKRVRITILGAVKEPGVHILKSPARLSNACETAGLLPWARRDSIVVRREGKEQVIELSRFYSEGDPACNPMIPTGAAVVVSSALENNQCILLETQSFFTPVAIGKATRVCDLPLLFPEGFGNFSQTHVSVRNSGGTRSLEGYTPYPLSPGDTVSIRSTDSKVYVSGMVAVPGSYDYSPSMTLHQYVGIAGGVLANGSLSGTRVYRDDRQIRLGRNDPLRPGDVVQVPVRNLSKFSEYLGIISGLASLVMVYALVANGSN